LSAARGGLTKTHSAGGDGSTGAEAHERCGCEVRSRYGCGGL